MSNELMPQEQEEWKALCAHCLGARIETTHFCPETGLIALGLYRENKSQLYLGIGPLLHGIGLGTVPPKIRANASHALVSAMRAHLLDRRILAMAFLPSGLLRIGVEGPEERAACLELKSGRKGCASLLLCDAIALEDILKELQHHQNVLQFGSDDPKQAAQLIRNDKLGQESDILLLARRKSELARAIKQQKQALERRMQAILGDLARLSDVEKLQRIGRLLLAQGGRIARGASEAILEDWEMGGTLRVELNPAEAPKSQAEGFFKKARRYQRGEAVMRKRLSEAEFLVSGLEALALELEAADLDLSLLEGFGASAKALGVRVRQSAVQADGKKAPVNEPRLPYNEFVSEQGFAILVGRGGADNDELTTKIAKPHDLWLHAKGVPGAHVLVPLDKNKACPAELLVDAATLAAHFSDARKEQGCEVSYVQRRYVRKPRKSPPGAVTLDREKVIFVRVEPERLSRLLAAKRLL